MPTREQIDTFVIQSVREAASAFDSKKPPAGQDDTFDDLGFDSLDRVELVIALEQEFSIEIPDDDVEKVFHGKCTSTKAVDYVARRVGAA